MSSTTRAQTEPTQSRLASVYTPDEHESRISARWRDASVFHVEHSRVLSGEKKPYCILIPPPNVTAALHLGHAVNNTIQDILVRAHRMRGFETLWMPGADHAGIATQTVVEKRLLAEEGRKRTDFQRDEFVARVQEWKDEYEATIREQLESMGCSCDWDRWRFTMDDQCARAVREAFFRLFKAGLIYRGKRLVNWDPVTRTALADDEVENRDVEGTFYYLRYPLVHRVSDGQHSPVTWSELGARGYPGAQNMPEDDEAWVTVATTRPETYLGDTAVAVNQNDPRATPLRGLFVELPLVGRVIPIVEDDYVVLPAPDPDAPGVDPKSKYATGFLKVTPAHDPNDWDLGQRHDLPIINVFAPDASISDAHGWDDVGDASVFLGKSREEARKLVAKEFEERGLLEETKPYSHSVGHSYRSHVPIEPWLSDQWYVRVTDDRLRGYAQRALAGDQRSSDTFRPQESAPSDGTMRVYPERYAKTYESWHDNLRDWCISRQLWWGHRIPVWSHPEGGAVPQSVRDHEADGSVSIVEFDGQAFVCVARDDEAAMQALEYAGFQQDPDVLDTWFSSALWPLSTLGWPEQTNLFKAFNPTSVLCTARDIMTLWVSRMVMMNRLLKGAPEVAINDERPDDPPFADVYIHAMIQDGEGRRMSKSLGNGVDPRDIIFSHGADAMRFTLCQMTTQTQDVRMPVEQDAKTGRNTSPKFDLGRKLANKLWNASRFTMMMLDEAEGDSDEGMQLIDRWMLSRVCGAIATLERAIADYQFSVYADTIYDLLWRDFCDVYLEAIKPTVKRNGAQRDVLRATLDAILRLMHPVCPFVTEAIFEALSEQSSTPDIPGVELVTHESGLLAPSSWPRLEPSLRNEEIERKVETMSQAAYALREMRSSLNIPNKARPIFHYARGSDAEGGLSGLHDALASLAFLGAVTDKAPPDGSVSTNMTGFPFDGACSLSELGIEAVDEDDARSRLEKQIDELTQSVSVLEKRLGNPGYVDKAPAHLVQQTRDEFDAKQQELNETRDQLARLGG
ncbi:MAG: valine--tRNA ligase [Phycisphaerales bacterium JB043]